jgi:cytochrome c oxidase subunit 2
VSTRVRAPAAAIAAGLALGGCRGVQSALDPAGEQAARVLALGGVGFAISAVVFVLVVVALLAAAFHRRPAGHVPAEPRAERKHARRVAALVGATVAVLFAWLVADFMTQRALDAPDRPDPLKITVIGKQWWWEVQYHDSVPAHQLTTANEIHVPVGRPVLVQLLSTDVIHSFWVPRLQGKRDLIPGYTNRLWIRADRPGRFRGQCAEFCGMQHAHMAFWVVAEPPAAFDAWYRRQLAPAAPPADSTRRFGEHVFLSSSCVMCHTIRGTPTGGRNGPDLTHVGSRLTLGAGTVPNVPGHLGGWVVDPQGIKPGSQMPPNQLRPEELRALIAYLEGLQ